MQQESFPPRPGTLAEAVKLQAAKGEFRILLAGFLDSFYFDEDQSSRYRRIIDEPIAVGRSKADALIGAIGEHLCHRWQIGHPPEWTNDPRRFLHEPWFMTEERMKPFALAESPSAFRRRFIFTEAEPLRRASMPKDGRWAYYESIRTGIPAEWINNDPRFKENDKYELL